MTTAPGIAASPLGDRPGAPPADGSPTDAGRTSRRPHLLRRAAVLVALGVPFWAVAVEPRMVDVVRQPVAVEHLPPAWAGRRVAVLADLQVGMWLGNEGTARAMVDRLTTEDPALVLVAGDLVRGADPADEEIARVADVLAPLPREGIPTVAVLGNHDYLSDGTSRLRKALRDVGVGVLANERVAVHLPDDPGAAPLTVVGIGPHIPERDRPEAAFAGLAPDVPRIVVMHNPATFADLPPGAAPFAVAGHTHGGQVRVPLLPHGSLPDLLGKGPVAGWSDGPGGNRLYVNRGVGMSRLPIRLACPPELTIFTLTSPDER